MMTTRGHDQTEIPTAGGIGGALSAFTGSITNLIKCICWKERESSVTLECEIMCILYTRLRTFAVFEVSSVALDTERLPHRFGDSTASKTDSDTRATSCMPRSKSTNDDSRF